MDDLITYLLNYAFDHGYGSEILNDAPADWPSVASPELKLVFINLNWCRPREIPFQIAHEIGHLLSGDVCQQNDLYHLQLQVENRADLQAIKILRQYCQDCAIEITNPLVFAQQFGIPYRLYNLVEAKWSA
ncbi:ImmA/IrrE family metallo-endopeptidase [Lactobacillus sp. DCY120]|uniref:ImmA/IrrE family metallo-endopeptidase n=1 Tax=Bombilactobacillus apium TaxID=2675299 RepID=A0A850R7H5_9LACO|nr:ImmA/IrrE family metallo-endopeptidase [Bombilactobacillus apium]NVY96622.1 ImmA/IrrE family metallo-endopeptidase [Bombilactobacillus apium]